MKPFFKAYLLSIISFVLIVVTLITGDKSLVFFFSFVGVSALIFGLLGQLGKSNQRKWIDENF